MPLLWSQWRTPIKDIEVFISLKCYQLFTIFYTELGKVVKPRSTANAGGNPAKQAPKPIAASLAPAPASNPAPTPPATPPSPAPTPLRIRSRNLLHILSNTLAVVSNTGL